MRTNEKLHKKSSNAWKNYWDGKTEQKTTVRLNRFQRTTLDEIERAIQVSPTSPARVLSAGSGYDVVALHLKLRHGDDVDISVLDISEICIARNRELFASYGLKAEFLVDDIFAFQAAAPFDVVYNTGLLEHFHDDEIVKILGNVEFALRPGGFYVTLNPSYSGKVYKYCQKIALRKKTWPYGPEYPLKGLARYLEHSEFELVREYKQNALTQFDFFRFVNKGSFVAVAPLIVAGKVLPLKVTDALAGPLFGYYSLVSILQRH